MISPLESCLAREAERGTRFLNSFLVTGEPNLNLLKLLVHARRPQTQKLHNTGVDKSGKSAEDDRPK